MKCRRDGELPGGRKGESLAVRFSHPAVTCIGVFAGVITKRRLLPFCTVSDIAVKKEVFYFGKNKSSKQKRTQARAQLFYIHSRILERSKTGAGKPEDDRFCRLDNCPESGH